LSATHEAAAALCRKAGCTPATLHPTALQTELRKAGAFIPI